MKYKMQRCYSFFLLLVIIGSNILCLSQDISNFKNEYGFTIPDSLLNRDFMIVTRVISCQTEDKSIKLFPGDVVNEKVIRFVKQSDNRIAILTMLKKEFCKPGAFSGNYNIYQQANRNDSLSIITLFENQITIPGYTRICVATNGSINSIGDIFFLKNRNNVGLLSYYPVESVVKSISDISHQIEMSAVEIYQNSKNKNKVTLALHTSLLILPPNPMKVRYSNPSLSYYEQAVNDTEKAEVIKVITRWRLEPKISDRIKYMNGQLVEPVKPIVFYIDPLTPAKWIPYFIKGVDDWQKAFEQAGFKNAIFGKMPPAKQQDSAWSIYSSRFGAIVYQKNPDPNGTYSTIIDPRSGEILESHVLMFEGVFRWLEEEYIIQASPSDKRARSAHLPESLLGELVRNFVSHEVGHALGFHHNMAGSSSIPLENLRNKIWVEKNGICNSIMDYARYNYVAQPNDNIKAEKGLIRQIGEYDKWAIEWGYRVIPGELPETAEKETLNKWIEAKAGDQRFLNGGEGLNNDPRSQDEDLGDDAIKAGKYGIANLKFVLSQLKKWTAKSATCLDDLKELYNNLTRQYFFYIGHVVKYIGGEYGSLTPLGEKISTPVNAAKQKEAIAFLQQHFFLSPEWLFDTAITSQIGFDKVKYLKNGINLQLSFILSPQKLIGYISALKTKNGLNIDDLFFLLREGLFQEVYSHDTISLAKKNSQTSYIKDLIWKVKAAESGDFYIPTFKASQDEFQSILTTIKKELFTIQEDISKNIPLMKDKASSEYLQNLQALIKKSL